MNDTRSCFRDPFSIWTSPLLIISASVGHDRFSSGQENPNKQGGQPCNNTLKEAQIIARLISLVEVEACNQELCADHLRCQSCEWGAWSEWGLCSKCGGQRAHLESLSVLAANRMRLQASHHREDAASPR